jgi:hypothetical protein
MRQYILQILVILVFSSFLLISGCNEKMTQTEQQGELTEKEVIQIAYDYLTTKASQLQGAAQGIDIVIQASFIKAIREATRDMMDEKEIEDWGDLISDNIESSEEKSIWTATWTGALERIAEYTTDGWWLVTIGDSVWRVSEKNKDIVAWNEEALKLLEEITLKTYYNGKYGYYLDYPPSWFVNDIDMSKVWIYPSEPKANEAYIYINVTSEEELSAFEDSVEYIASKLNLIQSQINNFELIDASPPRIHYTYSFLKDSPRIEVMRYFLNYRRKLYEIVCSSEISFYFKLNSISPLYDPFESFRFHP